MKSKLIKKTKIIKNKNNKNQLELNFITKIKKKNENKDKKDINFFYKENISSISRIFLSSFIIVSFFYIIPLSINFIDQNLNIKEFTNNSKKVLESVLSNNQKIKDSDQLSDSNDRDLIYDILDENNLDINIVRYTTSEINA